MIRWIKFPDLLTFILNDSRNTSYSYLLHLISEDDTFYYVESGMILLVVSKIN